MRLYWFILNLFYSGSRSNIIIRMSRWFRWVPENRKFYVFFSKLNQEREIMFGLLAFKALSWASLWQNRMGVKPLPKMFWINVHISNFISQKIPMLWCEQLSKTWIDCIHNFIFYCICCGLGWERCLKIWE